MLPYVSPFYFLEKQMTSSLGEALKTALARQWAEDDTAHAKMEVDKKTEQPRARYDVPNNVSRSTFNYIRDNPSKRADIVSALTKQGFNPGSVSSLVAQMAKQGMVSADHTGVYRATKAEYAPLKTEKKKKKIVLTRKRPVSSSPVAAPAPVPTPEPMVVQSPTVVTNEIEHILNTLPIKQAHALYVELQKIFGESK